MQVPYRKPTKFSYIKPDPQMTEAKFLALRKTLARLKDEQPAAAAEVARLAEMGDFSENAAYSLAKGRLRSLNNRLLSLQNRINHADVIQAPNDTGAVAVGHYVTVLTNGQEKIYQILGASETDPARGVISRHSPLGLALLGRRVGEIIKVQLTNKAVEYKIVAIKK